MSHQIQTTDSNRIPSAGARAIRRHAGLLGAAATIAASLLFAATGCNGTTTEPGAETTPSETISCGSTELYAVVHDECTAMDAQGVPDENGDCFCALGFAWDGSACVMLGNCACAGADCDKLTETEEQCQAEHATCAAPTPVQCGDSTLYSVAHEDCAPMDATATGEDGVPCNCMLGFAWNGTECEALANCACVGADCDKLTQTLEECQAEHATCNAPSGSGIQCGDPTLYAVVHDQCAPMDAIAADDEGGAGCFCMLGYAWDGTECVMLGNCRCLGEDCDKLTETIEQCQAEHASCG